MRKKVVSGDLCGLSGNNRDRRRQFRELVKKYGEGNVIRVDNPEAKCKNTFVRIRLPVVAGT
jgi:hypothetical protein